MPRDVRDFQHDWQHITNRCINDLHLMAPGEQTNALLGGILAEAIDRYHGRIEVLCFAFMSNHYHMIARGPADNPCLLSDFMRDVGQFISKQLGPLSGWHGTLWHHRFSAIPFVDPRALREKIGYILSHGVKESLVGSLDESPFFTSLAANLGARQVFKRYWRSEWTRKNGAARDLPIPYTEHELHLADLPSAVMTPSERVLGQAKWFSGLQAQIDAQADPMALGAELALDLGEPRMPGAGHRPLCHASTKAGYARYARQHECFTKAYRQASEQLRAGNSAAVFPPACFRPMLRANWEAKAYRLKEPIKLIGIDLAGGQGTLRVSGQVVTD